MDDEAILTLYRQRDSRAVAETEAKYGRLCLSVARNILSNREDSEECVNDTWLHAWNAIPPEWPLRFSAWLSRVTRNLAVSRLREQQAVEQKELLDAINRFLDGLDAAVRDVFIARYFYAASHSELSARTGWSVGKVKTVLRRTRLKLRTALKEEGLC